MKYSYFLLIALIMSSCATKVKPLVEYPITNFSANFEIGTIEAQFDRMTSFSKLKKGEIKVSYYPAEDLVCLRFRNEFITFYQYWYKISRQAFLSALERYKVDYETRNLPTKRNSSREYNQVDSFLVWESASYSTKGRSYPKINIGYVIKEKSPYFTLSQMEARNVDINSSSEKIQNIKQVLYFTRAQADNLAVLFDQDNLRILSAPVKVMEDDNPDKDNY